jgi:hypothetical protein
VNTCEHCLAEQYTWPKWADSFTRIVTKCDLCGRFTVCIYKPKESFVLNVPRTEWQCAARGCSGMADFCYCDPIAEGDLVIEIQRDSLEGIRCVVTRPDPYAAGPEYAGSVSCACAVVKKFLLPVFVAGLKNE